MHFFFFEVPSLPQISSKKYWVLGGCLINTSLKWIKDFGAVKEKRCWKLRGEYKKRKIMEDELVFLSRWFLRYQGQKWKPTLPQLVMHGIWLIKSDIFRNHNTNLMVSQHTNAAHIGAKLGPRILICGLFSGSPWVYVISFQTRLPDCSRKQTLGYNVILFFLCFRKICFGFSL